MNNKQPILLFDGVCNLCNGFVQFVIKRDAKSKFKFASLQSKTGQQYSKTFNLPTSDFTSFVFVENDKYYLKSSAALKVLSKLNGVWKLSLILFIFPKFLRDFVYDIIAKNRYKWFGKSESCLMPSPELQARFLD